MSSSKNLNCIDSYTILPTDFDHIVQTYKGALPANQLSAFETVLHSAQIFVIID